MNDKSKKKKSGKTIDATSTVSMVERRTKITT